MNASEIKMREMRPEDPVLIFKEVVEDRRVLREAFPEEKYGRW
jgi:hypothetical protein